MLDFEITYYKEHIFCVGGTWGVGAEGCFWKTLLEIESVPSRIIIMWYHSLI